ncbi:MAG: hypothetical protein CVT92_01620 [Bacteroidetes bacterium HGW-Bacteroidetes-1]|jgi:cyanophycinase|nr:MAG: hypothetical protein CVT92_01620 [Bacteroidetes bacterium HGW-Bacteroidetes-1]
MRLFIFTLLVTIGIQSSFSQNGRMLLVGGGSEKNAASGWSVPAYRWAAEGKRVAVIGYSTGSLANYLKQYCGASFAKEFVITSRDSANSQILFDTLLTYQVVFFRGGDQFDYYQYYKNTKLQEAAEHIYQNGGTLAGTSAGMHILSSVLFTAENGTVYPYEAIENPNNPYMTLANDFFDFFPGYIFDTHFSERGRFGRLVGFMAHYQQQNRTALTGFGMDDMTCMTVDENRIGTVYGTGCANIYTTESPFQLNGTKLLNEAVKVTQLIQGCSFDFNTREFTMPTHTLLLNTSGLEETGNYTLLASGGNTLSSNHTMLTDFVTNNGQTSDPVLILTGNETVTTGFKNYLLEQGAASADLFLVNNAAGSDVDLAEKIQSVTKILFVANEPNTFNQFLETENGILLKSRIFSNNIITAFVGDDARFAGKTVVENYYTEYASYYGELTFSEGLSLLKHSMIMPNTFFHSSMYENTSTAVPYVMARDTLKYGIWLTNKNYLKVKPEESKTTLTGYGAAPVMILRNDGGKAGFSTQTGTGGNSSPRMEAGFEQLTLSLIDYTTPYVLGNTNTSSVREQEIESAISFLTNPVKNQLTFQCPFPSFEWEIINCSGISIMLGNSISNLVNISTDGLASGVYIVRVTGINSEGRAFGKFIKH